MIDNLFNSTSIPILQQVTQFAQQRHQLLASNVANMDTPGYRVRDLSVAGFQNRLKQAIAEQRQPSLTSGMASSEARSSQPFERLSQGIGDLVHHDDSNVGVEQQVSELMKNQTQHNLAMTIMNSQFRLLQVAISERV